MERSKLTLATVALVATFASSETVKAAALVATSSTSTAATSTATRAADRAPENLTIVGKRLRVPGSAHVIDRQDLERFEQDDIHRVLQQVPGVYVRGEEGFGFRPNIGLRGASSERSAKITLMEDGILLAPAPYSAPAAYYFPITTRAVGVEIIKGPASIEHGPNTIGGAINLLSHPVPSGMEGNIDVAFGMTRFGKLHGNWGYGGDAWGVFLEGVHLQSDGFKDLDGGGDTGFQKNEALLKAYYGTDPDDDISHRIELKGGYADERSNETYLGLSDADFELTPERRYGASQRDRLEYRRFSIELSYLLDTEILDLRLTGYRHDFSRDWTKFDGFRGGPPLDRILANPNAGQSSVYFAVLTGQQDSATGDETLLLGTNARDFVSEGIQLVGHLRFSLLVPQEIEIGARFHHDQVERDHTANGFLMRSGTLVPEGGDPLPTENNRGRTFAWAFHLSDEIEIFDLLLTPGIRLEIIDTDFRDRLTGQEIDNRDVVLIPGVGASYQVTPWLGFLAGVYRGFSPVSPGQPEDVRPETSINYEAGARFSLGDTRAELIGFFNDYDNLTGECTFSSGCAAELLNAQFNAGEVFVYGLEASASQSIGLPFDIVLRAAISYTLTFSQFRSSFDSPNPQFGSVEIGDELAYVPEHQGALLASIEGDSFRFNVSVAYVGAMRDTAGQGEILERERIGAHAVIDLVGSYLFTENSLIYAKVDNLLDTAYVASRRPFGVRPGLPFQLQVGFKYSFDL